MDRDARIETLLDAARRGGGGLKVITESEMLELYREAAKRNLLMDAIEPFEIKNGFEIPRVDLTITPLAFHEEFALLNWEQRIAAMEDVITDLIEGCRKTGSDFRFNVWLSEKRDWIK